VVYSIVQCSRFLPWLSDDTCVQDQARHCVAGLFRAGHLDLLEAQGLVGEPVHGLLAGLDFDDPCRSPFRLHRGDDALRRELEGEVGAVPRVEEELVGFLLALLLLRREDGDGFLLGETDRDTSDGGLVEAELVGVGVPRVEHEARDGDDDGPEPEACGGIDVHWVYPFPMLVGGHSWCEYTSYPLSNCVWWYLSFSVSISLKHLAQR